METGGELWRLEENCGGRLYENRGGRLEENCGD